MFFEQMHESWQLALASQRELLEDIERKLTDTAYVPYAELVMRAFETPLDDVRVLLVGQDPYPTPGHAIGLSFAVDAGVSPLPRSLQNIMRELRDDLGKEVSNLGNLTRWSAQGVMLLNRHLTTSPSDAGAHFDLGWQRFTDEVVRVLNRKGRKLVAILWGAQAGELARLLPDVQKIESVHPSPLSARKGFFGSKPFSKTNQALSFVGEQPIDWSC